MKKFEEQYIQEWNKMVNEAHLNLTGTCPLIEDSVLIWINDLVQPLLVTRIGNLQ